MVALALVSAEKMRFDNHKVFNLNVENLEQMNFLRKLEETSPEGSYVFGDSPVVGRSVEIVVPPQKLYEFNDFTNHLSIDHELKVENLQA